MPSPPAAIFDLDGTLLDTLPDLHGALNRTLAAFGMPGHTPEGCRALVGHGIARLVRDALPEGRRGDGALLDAMRARFREDYREHQLDLTRPYPGITGLLERLRGEGWPLAVLSNKDHDNACAVVGHFFPGVFAATLGPTRERPPKPDPRGALEAAAILGRAPVDVCYLGDSEVDMGLAVTCGFVPIGVTWGFRPAGTVRAAGARYLIDSPGEFPGILEEGRGRKKAT
ncbi:MAG: HAD family hydrolase [Deltaproteobacteria bacterium]|jgi:phosphoglycolate phosphatase|nr:HAD family hydrolase [Deltaproteobacteria bacterium]